MLLQVCREFQRGSCTRQPSECRYAHPPDNVTVETCENQVTVCMDFIKGKCTRDSCKYFHPPPHLQAQIKAAQQRANSSAAHALVGFSPRSCQNQRGRFTAAANMFYSSIWQSRNFYILTFHWMWICSRTSSMVIISWKFIFYSAFILGWKTK